MLPELTEVFAEWDRNMDVEKALSLPSSRARSV